MTIYWSGKHWVVSDLEDKGLWGLYYEMCRSDGKGSVGQWKGTQIPCFIRFSNRVVLGIRRIGRGRMREFISKYIPQCANARSNIGEDLVPWPSSVRKNVVQGGKHALHSCQLCFEYQKLQLHTYAESLSITPF